MMQNELFKLENDNALRMSQCQNNSIDSATAADLEMQQDEKKLRKIMAEARELQRKEDEIFSRHMDDLK